MATFLAHSMPPPHPCLVHQRGQGEVGDCGPDSLFSGILESRFFLYKLHVHGYLNFSMFRFPYLQNMNVGNNNYLINCKESYMR